MNNKWKVSRSKVNPVYGIYVSRDHTPTTDEDLQFVEDRLNMQTPTGMTREEVLAWFDESIEEITKERGFAQTQEAKDMATWVLDGMYRARAAIAE